MDQPPPLAAGFSRIALLLEHPEAFTPGAIAQATGLHPDDLGPIVLVDHQVLVDVRAELGPEARERLKRLGATQLAETRNAPIRWIWIRLEVGRNHGLTMGHLRKLLDRAEAAPVGRLHINNTHTTIGLRDDKAEAVVASLNTGRINGALPRARLCEPGEMRESAAYVPR